MDWKKVLALLWLVPTAVSAQVSWNILYDFEFRKGGAGSSPERNDVVNRHPFLSVHRLQLFVDAAIDDRISFSSKLQNNVVIGEKLRDIEIQLAFLTYHMPFGLEVDVSAGRILTPFGLFARRQLSMDNPLIGFPLFFQYQLRVSPSVGYRPDLIPGDVYGGLSTMYLGGYNTGVEVFGTLADGMVNYDVAVMNAPMALFTNEINTTGGLSYQGRVGVRPSMFLEMGVSGNYGRFMDQNLGGLRFAVADSVSRDLDRYKQVTAGGDLTFSWAYYTIIAEYIVNRWNSPYVRTDVYPYGSGLRKGEELSLRSRELLIDARVDVPFVVGMYVAGRFNILTFSDIDNPRNRGISIAWDKRVRRYAVALGYKISRTVLLKGGYEWTIIDTDPRPYLNVWGMQLSAFF